MSLAPTPPTVDSPTPPAPRGSRLPPVIAALRPKQWTKNVLLFAALVFSFQFQETDQVLRALAGFACFSLISSAGYLFNDLRDREADARHPRKRHRPIASGRLSPRGAWIEIVVVLALGFTGAWLLSPSFALIALLYFCTTTSYTLVFKNLVIVDVMVIAAGFIWRAVAGAVVIDVHISEWLLLCTAFLALFLGFHKRRGELVNLGEDQASSHRKSLADYSPALVDQFQGMCSSGAVISYAIYTVLASPTPWLLITLPFVLYGIFRYTFLVQERGGGDAPDETLLKDRPILITCLLYAVTVVCVLIWAP